MLPLANIPRPLWLVRKSTYAAEVLCRNPDLGYWRCNDASGTVCLDQTETHPGNYEFWGYMGATLGAPGPIAGDTSSFAITPLVAPCVELPFATIPASLTLHGWVKIATTSQTFGYVVSGLRDCCQAMSGASLTAAKYSGQPAFEAFDNSQTQQTCQQPSYLTAGIWHHLAATFDGTNARLYQDGALTAGPTPMVLPAAASWNWAIGSFGYTNYTPGYLNGQVAEVAMHSHVLSAADMLTLHQKGMGTL